MYTSFFGLNEKPFSITPDPRYLFMSERHTEALAHLIYGVRESGGFIQLTGEVGTGKTTLARTLLQQVPDSADVAVILNPQLSRNEFLSAICEELGAPLPGSVNNLNTLTSALNAYLLENHSNGRRTILIVDEAQNLRIDVLEQVRLLTNLETTKQKLLQIILIGQPELREILDRNDMRQLAQRITGRYHLEPLSKEETRTYIDHRLKIAGAISPIFSDGAKRELHRLSQGVPRMINVIADRALLGAFAGETHEVTSALLRQAASEVLDERVANLSPWSGWLKIAGVATVATIAAFSLGWLYSNWQSEPEDIPALATQQPTVDNGATEPALADDVPALSTPSSDTPKITQPETMASGESAAAQPIPDNLLALALQENAEETTVDNAFNNLFRLWGVDYTPGTPRACGLAQANNLYCLFHRGSLSQVRNLDRPVILTLIDGDSQEHRVVLASLNARTAEVSIADETIRVNVAELSDLWFGEYLALWQPQSGEAKDLVPGSQDRNVRWLRASLSEIQGQPAEPMDSDIFDEDLVSRVQDYQRARRLTVDGLVGYRTQIAINSDLKTVERPTLARAD
jgi:general secretion pathway protein A